MADHVDDDVLKQYAQKLAGNSKTIRDRAFRKLKKWLEFRCQAVNGKNYVIFYPNSKLAQTLSLSIQYTVTLTLSQ